MNCVARRDARTTSVAARGRETAVHPLRRLCRRSAPPDCCRSSCSGRRSPTTRRHVAPARPRATASSAAVATTSARARFHSPHRFRAARRRRLHEADGAGEQAAAARERHERTSAGCSEAATAEQRAFESVRSRARRPGDDSAGRHGLTCASIPRPRRTSSPVTPCRASCSRCCSHWCPSGIAHVVLFGPGLLLQLSVAVRHGARLRGRWRCAGAVVTRRLRCRDGSVLVTAFLLAFSMPPLLPWWLTCARHGARGAARQARLRRPRPESVQSRDGGLRDPAGVVPRRDDALAGAAGRRRHPHLVRTRAAVARGLLRRGSTAHWDGYTGATALDSIRTGLDLRYTLPELLGRGRLPARSARAASPGSTSRRSRAACT